MFFGVQSKLSSYRPTVDGGEGGVRVTRDSLILSERQTLSPRGEHKKSPLIGHPKTKFVTVQENDHWNGSTPQLESFWLLISVGYCYSILL